MTAYEHDQSKPRATGAAITLVAGPFGRGGRLRDFIEGVQALPGVDDLRIVALQAGMLSLALLDTGASPLTERLATLSTFQFTVEESSRGAITLRLSEPEKHGE